MRLLDKEVIEGDELRQMLGITSPAPADAPPAEVPPPAAPPASV